jgi:hypothetical protein
MIKSSIHHSWPSLAGDSALHLILEPQMTESHFAPTDRLATWMYRASHGRVPYLVLKRLGIATPRRRGEFYTLDHLLRHIPEVRGSIIECGTYQGATLLGMAHVLNVRGMHPRIFGCDSFEGFPDPAPQDARDGGFPPDLQKGHFADTSYERLLERIRMLGWSGHVKLIKGFFENTLPQISDERFSMAHLDCDLYPSYMTCLKFVYPRMLPGSYIVFDEYACPGYLGAAKAVNEFFADKPEQIERLPDIPAQGAAGHELGVRHYVRIQRTA